MSPEVPEPADVPWVPARTSFFTALGVPISWVLAIVNAFRAPSGPGQRLWLRALIALAVFDVVVAVSFVYVARHSKELKGAFTVQPVKSVIGVIVKDDPIDQGLKVEEVTRGGPAEAANLVVGDVIDTCEGKPVRSRKALRACVGAFEPGSFVHLRVLRGEAVRENVPLLTAKSSDLAAPVLTPLPFNDTCDAKLKAPPRGPLIAWVLFVLLGVFVRLRGGGSGVLLLSLSIALIATFGTYITAGLCLAGAPEGTRELLELPLSPLSLLLVAWLINRFALQGQSPSVFSGSKTWWMTAGLAAWTHVLMMARIGIVIAAATLFFKIGPPSATPVEELISQGAQGPGMKLLVFITAAFLAPVAEESFFRGVAMTGLLRVMRPGFAIVALAIVFGLLHGGYESRTLIVISLGVILGWARWDSRGLAAPIALHFAQNAVVSVVFLMR